MEDFRLYKVKVSNIRYDIDDETIMGYMERLWENRMFLPSTVKHGTIPPRFAPVYKINYTVTVRD